MTSMKFLAAAACVLLLGAGCASSKPVSTPVATPVMPKVGDTLNGWKVVKVTGVGNDIPTSDRYAVLLKGPVELSGTYRYYNDASYGGWIVVFTPSAQDALKAPTGGQFIIMSDTEAAAAAIGLSKETEASGSATFAIDDFVYGKMSAVGSIGGATATFVRLVSKN